MLGYTEAELDEYFSDRMHAQAEKMGMTYDAYRAELRRAHVARPFGIPPLSDEARDERGRGDDEGQELQERRLEPSARADRAVK